MRVLSDTHAFLWFFGSDPRLSPLARSLFDDSSVTILLSIASVWETAIKVGLGKLLLPDDPTRYFAVRLSQIDGSLLPITLVHASGVAGLVSSAHRDPFDRMLVSQALCEGIPLLSGDRHLRDYDVRVLW